MSSEALAWAFRQDVKSSSVKFTLVALCECANYRTGRITPSIEHLVEITGQNRKTIITNIAELERSGLIVDTGERVGRTRQIKVYQAQIGTVPNSEPYQERNSSEFDRKQSQKRDTEPSSEPSLSTEAKASSESKSRKPAFAFDCPDGVDPIDWDALKQNRKAKRAPLTEGAHRQITRKLDDWHRAGWPPGPVVAFAAERGWTSVFETDEMKAAQNGHQRNPNHRSHNSGPGAVRDTRDGVARALDRRLGFDGPSGEVGRHDFGTGEGYRPITIAARSGIN